MAVGPINTTTLDSFRIHLNSIIDKSGKVTINIDQVNQIDASGVSVLREFYLNGLKYNREFSIVGYGCKELYDEFKFDQGA